MEQVIVVFKTHFDIGYTDMAADVVHGYRTSMIDSALAVVDDSQDLPEQQPMHLPCLIVSSRNSISIMVI